MSKIECDLCPRACKIEENGFGFCGVRTNRDGKIVLASYGLTTGICVDPIEKKPLYHFYPGSKVLSFGGIGCNLACRFCQNWSSSRAKDLNLCSQTAAPETIVRLAADNSCKSIAFTYNEPIIWAEYAVDTAKIARSQGIKTVAVTSGYISPGKREWFFEYIDAANVDLKSFSAEFYRKQCGVEIEPVKDTIRYLAKETGVWLELTTLLIPGLNDSEEELKSLSEWILTTTGPETPLHFSAFRPAYKMTEIPATPLGVLRKAREIAKESGLRHVYTGNVDDPEGSSTYCPQCNQCVIERERFEVVGIHLNDDECCAYCGQTIAGHWND